MRAPFEFETLYHKLKLFDEEAEMSVLGAMLLDTNAAIDILDKLNPADFLKPSHQELYDTLRNMYAKNQTVDSTTVKADLENRGRLEGVGGHDYLFTLMEFVPITSNAVHYAKIVKEQATLRSLARACGDILGSIQEPGRRLDELISSAQEAVFAISPEGTQKQVAKMDEVIEETFKQILDFREHRDRKSRLMGIPTGFYELDDLTCGLQPAHLYILAGRPSMGKSSLCFRMIEHAAITAEETSPVLLFSLEMSARQVCQQMLCSLARVSSHDVRHGRIQEEHVKSLSISAGKLSEANLWIDDSPDSGILEIRARARRLARRQKLGMVVIDYMQKIRSPGAESRQVEISMISSQLKSMSKELNVPVLAAAQLNRAPEGRKDRKPMLSDLRESGSIEQDADIVMLLYRDEYYNPKSEDMRGICEINVAKNRTGPVGEFQLAFVKEWTRFENLRRPEQAET